MKKYSLAILWSSLLALSAAVVSCTRPTTEPVAPDVSEEYVNVTFTVGHDAAATRAEEKHGTISDGTKVDKLICAIYDSNGKLLKQYGDAYDDEENGDTNTGHSNGLGQIIFENVEWPVKLDLTLVRSQKYKIVFWAQSSECDAYDTDDLKAVKIKYKSDDDSDPIYLNNAELRDAFCKTEEFSTTSVGNGNSIWEDGRITRNVTLRRPFAQINVGASENDFKKAKDAGYEISKSKITIRNAATQFNVVDNTVDVFDESGAYSSTPSETVTFGFSTIPAYINDKNLDTYEEEFLYAELAQDEFGLQKFKYLSMCYVLAADKNAGTSTYAAEVELDISFMYEDTNKGTFTINASDKYTVGDQTYDLMNVPLQRNWCTNIILTAAQLYPHSDSGDEPRGDN